MRAELIDSMGTDLTVVNAARVSFDKESRWESFADDVLSENELSQKDQKLISYLAKHNHWTPFSHVMITMRETVPIFVARQRFKHMVGFTYNEVSRRYVSDEPSFYVPDSWRKAAESKKQGSSDEIVTKTTNYYNMTDPNEQYEDIMNMCKGFYEHLLSNGIAPEQARMVLPQSMYTSYYVTGSLAAWARAYNLRIKEGSQKEIQDLAKQWDNTISNIDELKYSWGALTKEVTNS